MTDPAPLRAGAREWVGLAVLVLPTMLIAIDMSVLHLAVPEITANLRPTGSQVLWITDIYPFMIAGFLVTMGALGDRVGRRRLLLIGAACFGAASALAAYSDTATTLIAARALLGIAGATLMPSTLSLIRNMFPAEDQRKRAISIWMAGFIGGAAAGPLVGGVLLEHFWWGSVLLIGVPIMLLLLVTGPFLLPEYRDPNAGSIDLPSAVMATVVLVGVTYAFKDFAENGPGWKPLLVLVAALALGTRFIARQRSLTNPLVDPGLFSSRTFGVSLTLLMTSSVVMMGIMFFVTLHLQMVMGFTPLTTALWMLPITMAMIVGTMTAPTLAKRISTPILMAGGLSLGVVALLVLTRVESVSSPLLLVACVVILAVGMGPASMLSTDMVVSSAPKERAGSASALSETGTELGAAVGLALIGSLGFAVYRARLSETMPAEVPTDVAVTANDTLGAALEEARHLPGDVGENLLTAARDAFTSGLHAGALLSAALLTLSVLLILTVLRKASPGTGDAPDPAPVTAREKGAAGNPAGA
ncbi:MFS transporter [Streptomyces calidiresistens]|uniref:MFS transporter n=1 Tax=Streptomyces calidiresistens TaxID=1485586 RepID=A0A7W3T386_9ACTN|nr:MFS transporter [Streptomyces calidiresistens]MBB0230119.1 MFS transporter [Streptomyces calidiresistens]